MPGIETLLPMMLQAVGDGLISMARLVELLCFNPARIFRLFPRKGQIMVGADADLVLLNLREQWSLSSNNLYTKAGYTPFEGQKIPGKIVATFVRGKPVWERGMFRAQPGWGRMIGRQFP